MNKLISLLALALLAGITAAQSPPILPDMPRHGYVLDKADLLSHADVSSINHMSAESKRDHQAPIVVVTIRSLSEMHAGGMTIESYATKLFNAWQIGSAVSNKGVLVLVAKDDHKARIEMGESWAHSKDGDAAQIMQDTMIPQFKAGSYGAGITAGVRSVQSLVAGNPVSSDSVPWNSESTSYTPGFDSPYSGGSDISSAFGALCFCPFIIFFIVIAGIVSAAKSGFRRRYYPGGFWGGGWGGGTTNNFFTGGFGSSSSSSGFSGGSDFSGGGSSGGGGASGSW